MKCNLIKFFLWQIWFIAACCLFFDKSLAVLFCVFFAIVDFICLIVLVIKRKTGKSVEVSARNAFDIIPYKWFGFASLLGVFTVIHGEEYLALCLFLWITLLLGYIFDAVDRLKKWQKRNRTL